MYNLIVFVVSFSLSNHLHFSGTFLKGFSRTFAAQCGSLFAAEPISRVVWHLFGAETTSGFHQTEHKV